MNPRSIDLLPALPRGLCALALAALALSARADGEVLKSVRWKHLSVADAKLAPCGQAARETLAALRLTDAAQARVVAGENIAQAL